MIQLDLEDAKPKRASPDVQSPTDKQAVPVSTLLSFNYLQGYFDVNQNEIRDRLLLVVSPHKASMAGVLAEKPDLYGPFWIATSLVFCLFAFGNLSGIFGAGSYSYDLIGSAASCVYG